MIKLSECTCNAGAHDSFPTPHSRPFTTLRTKLLASLALQSMVKD